MGAYEAFKDLTHGIGLSEEDPLLRDYLRIMRERQPDICGMAFDFSDPEDKTVWYWDKNEFGHLAAWSISMGREAPKAVYFLYRGYLGEEPEQTDRAHFFGQLFVNLQDA